MELPPLDWLFGQLYAAPGGARGRVPTPGSWGWPLLARVSPRRRSGEPDCSFLPTAEALRACALTIASDELQASRSREPGYRFAQRGCRENGRGRFVAASFRAGRCCGGGWAPAPAL